MKKKKKVVENQMKNWNGIENVFRELKKAGRNQQRSLTEKCQHLQRLVGFQYQHATVDPRI